MAEHFPGYTPEASSDDDDDSKESKEKKTSKKTERSASKESGADTKAEKREREDAVPLEKLADDETSAIGAELARLRAGAAQREVLDAADGSIEQTEAIPVVEFDEALQRNLEDGQSFDEALENAEAAATELIGDEVEAGVDEDTPEVEPDEAEDNDDDDANTAPQNPSTPLAGGAPPNGPGRPVGGVGPANPGGGGGNGARGGTPPHPPVGAPPHQAPPGGPAGPVGPGGPGGAGGHNAYYAANAPAAANLAPTQAPEQKSVAPYVLAGGLVGYLIGRRRGRIKTERRLMPIQKKLEKQVTNLEEQIVLREEKIRTLTRKQAEAQPALQAAMAERKQAQRAGRSEKEKPKETVVVEQKRVAGERLGKLAFKQEAFRTSSAEQRVKPVELMTKPELLAIAEHIKVEQGNVKRLYETGRLDDKGMRRVLEAYLSGKPYERVLREQLLSTVVQGIESDPSKISEQPISNGSAGGASSSTDYHGMTSYLPPAHPANPMSPPQSSTSGVPSQPIPHYVVPKANNTKRNVVVTVAVVAAAVILLFVLF